MSSHRLAPLLEPASIAVIGASQKPGSPGHNALLLYRGGRYSGRVYAVNPNYQAIDDQPCYASLAALPETVDLAVLLVADQHLESALRECIDSGVRAAAIFGGANLHHEHGTALPERLASIARAAGLPVCGGNGMGFFNLDSGLLCSFMRPTYEPRRGPLALISHSGSSWSSLTFNDRRLGFNLSVSAGQEFTVGVADYLDYALRLETTRAVGLVLETIRDPQAFVSALQLANDKHIPVVALKAGRTPQSARLAISHSGAIAGDDAAYEAVFARYGVSRVSSLEELAATLCLLAHATPPERGGLACIHDSGFERELLIDLASDAGVRLAELGDQTRAALGELLDPGLEPVNPLDAWGTGRDYQRVFTESFCALLDDPDTALGIVCHSPRDNYALSDAWLATCLEGAERNRKPVAYVTHFSWTRHPQTVARLTEAGIPVIEGLETGLRAVAHAQAYSGFLNRPPLAQLPEVAAETSQRWRQRLASGPALGEQEGLALLGDYGISVAPTRSVENLEQCRQAAAELGFPLVLKTAAAGVHHKSDIDGIRLGLTDFEQLDAAWHDLSARLGNAVTVAAMIEGGIEMSAGLVRDPQFGPLVMIGAGGVMIELLGDRCMLLPPFDSNVALRYIESLRAYPLLCGVRGRSPVSARAFADAAVSLARLALDLGDLIDELDVNPIIVRESDAIAVDALVIASGARHEPDPA